MRKYPEREGQDTLTSGEYLSGELFENLDRKEKLEEQKKQSDLQKLREVFSHLFGTENLGNYCCYTNHDKQCSDGSDLYSIIKYNGKDLIIKVGAGEFNTDVFNTGGIKELKGFYNTPIPLFVVNQSDSYFADEDQKNMRIHNPKEYLEQFATIVVPQGGKAYFLGYKNKKNKIDKDKINIKYFNDALASGRLAILNKEFPNGQLEYCLDIIKDFQKMDFDKFYSTVWKNRQFIKNDDKENNPKGYNMTKVLGCFWNMGVNRIGSGVGDIQAYKSLYDLIQSFDLQKKSF